jgi:hypothetical protein
MNDLIKTDFEQLILEVLQVSDTHPHSPGWSYWGLDSTKGQYAWASACEDIWNQQRESVDLSQLHVERWRLEEVGWEGSSRQQGITRGILDYFTTETFVSGLLRLQSYSGFLLCLFQNAWTVMVHDSFSSNFLKARFHQNIWMNSMSESHWCYLLMKKWRAETQQSGLEIGNFKPRLKMASSNAYPGWTVRFSGWFNGVFWKRKSRSI